MTLSDWLSKPNSPARRHFAEAIGVSRQALDRYIKGERFPRPSVMRQISVATKGAVRANDFLIRERETA